MKLLNYKSEYKNFTLESKFENIVSNNKYKILTSIKKDFLNDKEENVNAMNLITEFNKINRLFILVRNEKNIQSKIYKRAFSTFLTDNFLNYLFLNKIFQWFFFFLKKFNKKKTSKEVGHFFFSKLLLKNIDFFFKDDFLKLIFSYDNFLKKYFYTFFLTLKRKKNWKSKGLSGYRKNKSYYIKNRSYWKNTKRNLRTFYIQNSNIKVDNNVYLKLFFLKKKKRFKFNLNNFKVKGIRFFLRKKKIWYYKLRFKKRWYVSKYLYMRKKYNSQQNKTFFYLESFYKLYQRFNKAFFIKKFLFKPKNYHQLQLIYKRKLNFFFKKIKSNVFFPKNNDIMFFLNYEKKFLLLLEASHYQILLNYFYPRISNYDFISTKN